MTIRRCCAAASILALAGGCRIDPIESLDVDAPPAVAESRLVIIPEAEVRTPEVVKLENELRGRLSALAGPFFQGRRPGSESAPQIARYLVSALDESGMLPAAPGGGWLQPVSLVVRTTTGSVSLAGDPPVAIDGIAFARAPEPDAAGPLRLVDAGFGVTAPEWGLDEYASINARGAAVLAREGVPDGQRVDTIYAARDYKLERAKRAGAAAVLLASGVSATDASWPTLAAAVAGPRVQTVKGDEPSLSGVVWGLVSQEGETQLRGALSGGNASVVLDLKTEVRQVDDANVIGRIVGEEHPEQSVVVLAHWDAGGYAPPAAAGGGAEDNAAGVAIALAIAARFGEWARAGRRPSRSVVFVFTAGDSLGAHGTRRFGRSGSTVAADIAAAVVLRGFDLDAPAARLISFGAERTSLDAMLRGVFGDRLEREAAGAPRDILERVVLDTAGLTTIAFSRLSSEGTLGDDPFGASVGLGDLARETEALFDLVWRLATDPAMPTRVDQSAPPAADTPARAQPVP